MELVPVEAVALLAYVGSAAAASVHVLLWKDDVRAAAGWIGLAWLSPFLGPALYGIFGINRIARRGARIERYGHTWASPREASPLSELPSWNAVVARAGDRLRLGPVVGGNSVVFLRYGEEAYPPMLRAIKEARHSVALATYIFRDSGWGRTFIDALADARARGVEVRVLVDGAGGGYLRTPAVRALWRRDVPAARFMHHWMPWRMPFLNMRCHKKLLIADGRLGFTGGINIGDEYMEASPPEDTVEDVLAQVEGPAVRQLMRSFAADWRFTTGEALKGDGWWPCLKCKGRSHLRGIESGPDEQMGKLESILAVALSAATRRVRVVSPYFLPDRVLVSALTHASLRGLRVEMVMPARSDRRFADWATYAHLGFFPDSDARVFLSPPPFDHAKLVTVDGKWGLVGTANWDVRSMRLNFEFGLECHHPATVADIDRLIDAKVERSREHALSDFRHGGIPTRLRNCAARLLLPYL